jgi:hypothetical protein
LSEPRDMQGLLDTDTLILVCICLSTIVGLGTWGAVKLAQANKDD